MVVAAFSEPAGRGRVQIGELLLVAFALSSVIGLERQLRSKNAGLRSPAVVGTASALFLLVSKYGFSDVLVSGPRSSSRTYAPPRSPRHITRPDVVSGEAGSGSSVHRGRGGQHERPSDVQRRASSRESLGHR
jgi:MgtC family protein